MSSFRVPAIDISPYVTHGSASSRATVAADMDHACSTVGFVQIHGHGIDPGVIAGLTDAADAFFGLPLAEKNRWRRPASENRGYSPPKSESLRLSLDAASTNNMNDFFEAFNVGRSWMITRTSPTTCGITTPRTSGRTSTDSTARCGRTSVKPNGSRRP